MLQRPRPASHRSQPARRRLMMRCRRTAVQAASAVRGAFAADLRHGAGLAGRAASSLAWAAANNASVSQQALPFKITQSISGQFSNARAVTGKWSSDSSSAPFARSDRRGTISRSGAVAGIGLVIRGIVLRPPEKGRKGTGERSITLKPCGSKRSDFLIMVADWVRFASMVTAARDCARREAIGQKPWPAVMRTLTPDIRQALEAIKEARSQPDREQRVRARRQRNLNLVLSPEERQQLVEGAEAAHRDRTTIPDGPVRQLTSLHVQIARILASWQSGQASHEQLAHAAGTSVRTVRRALPALRALGLLRDT